MQAPGSHFENTALYICVFLVYLPVGNLVPSEPWLGRSEIPVEIINFLTLVTIIKVLMVILWVWCFYTLSCIRYSLSGFLLSAHVMESSRHRTNSTIPSYKWHQDPGVDVPLEEHVLKYICFYENSWFLSDRKLSVKQIILFWDSPAIYICFCISIWEIFQLSQMGFLRI